MTTLILVRHGETLWNVEVRFQGQRDIGLNERGREQARQVAEHLRGAPIQAVYSSDLIRSVDTARAIADVHGLSVSTDAALRERNFGVWEGLNREEVSALWAEEWQRWRQAECAPPDGETVEEVVARVKVKITEIVSAHPDQTIVAVGHGGSVKAAVISALSLPLTEWRSFPVGNASVTVLQFHLDRVELVRLNDTHHLNDGLT
jgi:broad specificity phosphatase PhoE